MTTKIPPIQDPFVYQPFRSPVPQFSHYRYRLLPDVSPVWTRLGTQRQVTFSGLKPGNYAFELDASGPYGWRDQPISLAIRVVPPWYGSSLAKVMYALFAALTLLALALGYRYHVRLKAARTIAQQNRAQQNQKMEALGRLAGGIAHDFNNVLASIMGFNRMAAKEVDRTSRLGRLLDEIDTATKMAKDMVAGVLTFARKGKPKYEAVEAVGVIRDALKLCEASLPAATMLNRHIQPKQCWIWGNASQVSQIVLNLIGNAAQALHQGQGCIDVAVSVGEPPQPTCDGRDWLLLRVSDTGCGIHADDLDRIFEPFFSTKPPHEGSGMGLSMVHGIISEMTGRIVVESEPGQTRFDIWFPTREPPLGDEVSTEDERIRGQGERILWVDDDPALLQSGCAMLSELGYVPTPIESAAQAREVAVADAFDLIILDLILKDGSGVDLYREFAQRGYQNRIIFCTGALQELEKRGLTNVGLLSKPFSQRALAQRVSAMVKQLGGAVAS